MIKVTRLNEEPEKRRQRAKENSSGQEEFHLADEIRTVTSLIGSRCPGCGCIPDLWRLPNPKTGRPMFQVVCPNTRKSPRSHSIFCQQEPVPAEPVDQSIDAVRAWRLVVKLSSS